MNILIRIIAIIGIIVSVSGIIYILKSNRKIKKLKTINDNISEYIKDDSFLIMRNDGYDPCDANIEITAPDFSQNAKYIIRRKMLWHR